MLRSVLVIALLATASLLAADLPGKWTGTIETNGSRVPIHLTLTSDGQKIGGSVATGNDTKEVPIEKAELNSGDLSFEVHDNASRLMRFRLALTGTSLGGEATVGSEKSTVSLSKLYPLDDVVGSGAYRVGGGVTPPVYRVGGGVTPPTLLRKTGPEYTEEARAAKFQGTVVLYVEIGPDGTATNIKVQRSLGMGLDEKAVEAVKKWQFSPGKKDGNPVTVAATIEVNFRLPD